VTNKALALLHGPYDYPLQTESESLGQIRAYASQTPLLTENSIGSLHRSDGYGLLGQQLVHSMPLHPAKPFGYASQPSILAVPS